MNFDEFMEFLVHGYYTRNVKGPSGRVISKPERDRRFISLPKALNLSPRGLVWRENDFLITGVK